MLQGAFSRKKTHKPKNDSVAKNGEIAVKAVLIEKFQQAPKLVTVDDPIPEPHGVVIKVEATGVCRSDRHAWMGHDTDVNLPHVP